MLKIISTTTCCLWIWSYRWIHFKKCMVVTIKTSSNQVFPGEFIFFQASGQECEVVMSATGSSLRSTPVSPKQFIKKAAEYLRQDILLYQERSMKTSWPPTAEKLSGEDRDFPESLMEFFTSSFFDDKSHQRKDYTSIPRLLHCRYDSRCYSWESPDDCKTFCLRFGIA